MDSRWTRTSDRLPDKQRDIIWISPGGIQSRGQYLGGAVWMPEGSDCYVCYTPEFWQYA